MDDLKREIMIMKKMKHTNIVSAWEDALNHDEALANILLNDMHVYPIPTHPFPLPFPSGDTQ